MSQLKSVRAYSVFPLRSSHLLVVLLLFASLQNTWSQSVDYRSRVSGGFDVAGSWENTIDGSTWITATQKPTNESNILIQAGHNMTLNSNVVRVGVTTNNGTLSLKNYTLTIKNVAAGSGIYNGDSTSSLVIDSTVGGVFTIPTPVTLQNITVSGNRTFALTGTGDLTLHGDLIINSAATFDNGGESQIRKGSSGSPAITVNGVFVCRDADGFTGTNATISALITVIINPASTIEYGLAGNQVVTNRADYCNLTFSGSGTKTPTSGFKPYGTVLIKDNAILDVGNKTFGDSTATNLQMTGGRFRIGGTGVKPDIRGAYTLTGGVIEFTNKIIDASTLQTIRLSPGYANIEISGDNVGTATAGGSIKINSGGSFIVKTNGAFKLQNLNGFSGASNTAVDNTHNPTITLEAGSAIEYNATSGTQTVTGRTDYSDVTLSGAALKVMNGTPSIAGNFTVSGGAVTAASSIIFNGASGTQKIAGINYNSISFINNAVKRFLNTASISFSGTLSIVGGTVDLNNNKVSLKAGTGTDYPNAAIVGEVGSGATISYGTSGAFVFERYIPGRRAYRFLSSPVTTSTSIKANWMEGQNNPAPAYSINNNSLPGYGTHITGSANSADGFDVTATNNPSLFTFNNASQMWETAANTAGSLTTGVGYRLLVRGSRSVDLSNNSAASTGTILRATGTLQTGPVVYNTSSNPAINGSANSFSFVGNPYASPVDWNTLARTGLSAYYYVWDPNLNTRGAYVTYGNGITNPAQSNVDQNIQAGQAFFVSTISANPSLTFNEVNKTVVTKSVFRTSSLMPTLAIQLLTDTTAGGEHTADGVTVLFDDNFAASIAAEDAAKITNLDENLSILSNRISLSVEGRPLIIYNDTVHIQVSQFRQKHYYLKFNSSNFPPTMAAIVRDNFLKEETTVDLLAGTVFPFSVTSDSGSFSPGRFEVVFKSSQVLAATTVDIKAFKKDEGIQVQWAVNSEAGIERYEVEKSISVGKFEKRATVAVKGNGTLPAQYNWFDTDQNFVNNFYRIKCIEKAGTIKYSKQVNIKIERGRSWLLVSPNPVIGNTFSMRMTSLEKGIYNVRLYNSTGQMMYKGFINHNDVSQVHQIILPKVIPNGNYKLEITGGSNTFFKNIIVQ